MNYLKSRWKLKYFFPTRTIDSSPPMGLGCLEDLMGGRPLQFFGMEDVRIFIEGVSRRNEI